MIKAATAKEAAAPAKAAQPQMTGVAKG